MGWHFGSGGGRGWGRSRVSNNPVMMIPFGGIFMLVGLGVSWWGFSLWSKASASKEWPTAQGKILSSEVQRRHSSGSRRRSSSTTYAADVRYEYTVEGQHYTGEIVSFGDYSSSNRGHASGIVSRYPRGKTVEVYYNPKDPGEAVLETGSGFGVFIPLLIGLLFALVGAGVAAGGAYKLSQGGSGSGRTSRAVGDDNFEDDRPAPRKQRDKDGDDYALFDGDE